MVGSVLMERMEVEEDFQKASFFLFSSSQKGRGNHWQPQCHSSILDSFSLDELTEMDIILSCQGGAYTEKVHPALRAANWQGIWIDAASSLRMNDSATIVLDPVNKGDILRAFEQGKKDFIGGNCTVSLMLMALGGLLKAGEVEWISSHTYQAASGAGAKAIFELLEQNKLLTSRAFQGTPGKTALELEKEISQLMKGKEPPADLFGQALAFSLLPWIDTAVEGGQTREEWKAQVEANKILNSSAVIPIDGTCVRVSTLRCHSQAFTIKLKRNLELKDVEELITQSGEWTRLIPNEKEPTLESLSPKNVSGTLNIPVGRVRKMNLGDSFINAFAVGDQLLWGAAEPLRRTLTMYLSSV